MIRWCTLEDRKKHTIHMLCLKTTEINVSEYRRGNHIWTIQRKWQQRVRSTYLGNKLIWNLRFNSLFLIKMNAFILSHFKYMFHWCCFCTVTTIVDFWLLSCKNQPVWNLIWNSFDIYVFLKFFCIKTKLYYIWYALDMNIIYK
jgi:hypothetical protein